MSPTSPRRALRRPTGTQRGAQPRSAPALPSRTAASRRSQAPASPPGTELRSAADAVTPWSPGPPHSAGAASPPAQGERRRRRARHIHQRRAPGMAAGGDGASAEILARSRASPAEGGSSGREGAGPALRSQQPLRVRRPPRPPPAPRLRSPPGLAAGSSPALAPRGGRRWGGRRARGSLSSARPCGTPACLVVARQAIPVPACTCVWWINVVGGRNF